MKKSNQIKKMVGVASLAAIVSVLQVIANYITFGPVSITLALIPLVIGGIIYGPSAGALLGIIMGGIILTAPSTASFLAVNAFATVVLCLVKTAAAGWFAGFIFSKLRKINFKLAVIVSTISVPLINTGLFAVGCILFFMPTLKEWAGGSNALTFLFITMIGINFLIEFSVNSILAPTVMYIVRVISNNLNIGTRTN